LTGAVRVDGVELELVPVREPGKLFRRLLDEDVIDAAELSLSNYLTMLSRGDLRFVGLPVFTYRAFRHSMLWVRIDGKVRAPQDLVGRRIGIPEYGVTALVFLRGMLQRDFGVGPEDVTWVRSRPERLPLRLPTNIRIEDAHDTTADELLASGDLDAVANFTQPLSEGGQPLPVRRLFDDVIAVEADYFHRTGIFPIMHLIVVRRELYNRHPWLASSLMRAFEHAKQLCYETAGHDFFAVSTSLTPWLRVHAEQAAAVFGGDLYPYGVEPNRRTLNAAVTYAHEQHLTDRLVDLTDPSMFAPETLDLQSAAVPSGASG
jgi:4,5-dihydroxyphthalate decarboxylase